MSEEGWILKTRKPGAADHVCVGHFVAPAPHPPQLVLARGTHLELMVVGPEGSAASAFVQPVFGCIQDMKALPADAAGSASHGLDLLLLLTDPCKLAVLRYGEAARPGFILLQEVQIDAAGLPPRHVPRLLALDPRCSALATAAAQDRIALLTLAPAPRPPLPLTAADSDMLLAPESADDSSPDELMDPQQQQQDKPPPQQQQLLSELPQPCQPGCRVLCSGPPLIYQGQGAARLHVAPNYADPTEAVTGFGSIWDMAFVGTPAPSATTSAGAAAPGSAGDAPWSCHLAVLVHRSDVDVEVVLLRWQPELRRVACLQRVALALSLAAASQLGLAQALQPLPCTARGGGPPGAVLVLGSKGVALIDFSALPATRSPPVFSDRKAAARDGAAGAAAAPGGRAGPSAAAAARHGAAAYAFVPAAPDGAAAFAFAPAAPDGERRSSAGGSAADMQTGDAMQSDDAGAAGGAAGGSSAGAGGSSEELDPDAAVASGRVAVPPLSLGSCGVSCPVVPYPSADAAAAASDHARRGGDAGRGALPGGLTLEKLSAFFGQRGPRRGGPGAPRRGRRERRMRAGGVDEKDAGGGGSGEGEAEGGPAGSPGGLSCEMIDAAASDEDIAGSDGGRDGVGDDDIGGEGEGEDGQQDGSYSGSESGSGSGSGEEEGGSSGGSSSSSSGSMLYSPAAGGSAAADPATQQERRSREAPEGLVISCSTWLPPYAPGAGGGGGTRCGSQDQATQLQSWPCSTTTGGVFAGDGDGGDGLPPSAAPPLGSALLISGARQEAFLLELEEAAGSCMEGGGVTANSIQGLGQGTHPEAAGQKASGCAAGLASWPADDASVAMAAESDMCCGDDQTMQPAAQLGVGLPPPPPLPPSFVFRSPSLRVALRRVCVGYAPVGEQLTVPGALGPQPPAALAAGLPGGCLAWIEEMGDVLLLQQRQASGRPHADSHAGGGGGGEGGGEGEGPGGASPPGGGSGAALLQVVGVVAQARPVVDFVVLDEAAPGCVAATGPLQQSREPPLQACALTSVCWPPSSSSPQPSAQPYGCVQALLAAVPAPPISTLAAAGPCCPTGVWSLPLPAPIPELPAGASAGNGGGGGGAAAGPAPAGGGGSVLVFSFLSASRALATGAQGLADVTELAGLVAGRATLACALVADRWMVQVTPLGVQLACLDAVAAACQQHQQAHSGASAPAHSPAAARSTAGAAQAPAAGAAVPRPGGGGGHDDAMLGCSMSLTRSMSFTPATSNSPGAAAATAASGLLRAGSQPPGLLPALHAGAMRCGRGWAAAAHAAPAAGEAGRGDVTMTEGGGAVAAAEQEAVAAGPAPSLGPDAWEAPGRQQQQGEAATATAAAAAGWWPAGPNGLLVGAAAAGCVVVVTRHEWQLQVLTPSDAIQQHQHHQYPDSAHASHVAGPPTSSRTRQHGNLQLSLAGSAGPLPFEPSCCCLAPAVGACRQAPSAGDLNPGGYSASRTAAHPPTSAAAPASSHYYHLLIGDHMPGVRLFGLTVHQAGGGVALQGLASLAATIPPSLTAPEPSLAFGLPASAGPELAPVPESLVFISPAATAEALASELGCVAALQPHHRQPASSRQTRQPLRSAHTGDAAAGAQALELPPSHEQQQAQHQQPLLWLVGYRSGGLALCGYGVPGAAPVQGSSSSSSTISSSGDLGLGLGAPPSAERAGALPGQALPGQAPPPPQAPCGLLSFVQLQDVPVSLASLGPAGAPGAATATAPLQQQQPQQVLAAGAQLHLLEVCPSTLRLRCTAVAAGEALLVAPVSVAAATAQPSVLAPSGASALDLDLAEACEAGATAALQPLQPAESADAAQQQQQTFQLLPASCSGGEHGADAAPSSPSAAPTAAAATAASSVGSLLAVVRSDGGWQLVSLHCLQRCGRQVHHLLGAALPCARPVCRPRQVVQPAHLPGCLVVLADGPAPRGGGRARQADADAGAGAPSQGADWLYVTDPWDGSILCGYNFRLSGHVATCADAWECELPGARGSPHHAPLHHHLGDPQQLQRAHTAPGGAMPPEWQPAAAYAEQLTAAVSWAQLWGHGAQSAAPGGSGPLFEQYGAAGGAPPPAPGIAAALLHGTAASGFGPGAAPGPSTSLQPSLEQQPPPAPAPAVPCSALIVVGTSTVGPEARAGQIALLRLDGSATPPPALAYSRPAGALGLHWALRVVHRMYLQRPVDALAAYGPAHLIVAASQRLLLYELHAGQLHRRGWLPTRHTMTLLSACHERGLLAASDGSCTVCLYSVRTAPHGGRHGGDLVRPKPFRVIAADTVPRPVTALLLLPPPPRGRDAGSGGVPGSPDAGGASHAHTAPHTPQQAPSDPTTPQRGGGAGGSGAQGEMHDVQHQDGAHEVSGQHHPDHHAAEHVDAAAADGGGGTAGAAGHGSASSSDDEGGPGGAGALAAAGAGVCIVAADQTGTLVLLEPERGCALAVRNLAASACAYVGDVGLRLRLRRAAAAPVGQHGDAPHAAAGAGTAAPRGLLCGPIAAAAAGLPVHQPLAALPLTAQRQPLAAALPSAALQRQHHRHSPPAVLMTSLRGAVHELRACPGGSALRLLSVLQAQLLVHPLTRPASGQRHAHFRHCYRLPHLHLEQEQEPSSGRVVLDGDLLESFLELPPLEQLSLVAAWAAALPGGALQGLGPEAAQLVACGAAAHADPMHLQQQLEQRRQPGASGADAALAQLRFMVVQLVQGCLAGE